MARYQDQQGEFGVASSEVHCKCAAQRYGNREKRACARYPAINRGAWIDEPYLQDDHHCEHPYGPIAPKGTVVHLYMGHAGAGKSLCHLLVLLHRRLYEFIGREWVFRAVPPREFARGIASAFRSLARKDSREVSLAIGQRWAVGSDMPTLVSACTRERDIRSSR